MKKDLGPLLALYPTPLTVVGAMTDGKPSWMEAAHVGIIGHDRVTISCAAAHHTSRGIRESGVCTVNLVNAAMLKKADYVGSVSGNKTDKSGVFAWTSGKSGGPVIAESPLVLECRVADVYKTPGFETFILQIDHTYAEESCLDESGKPDYEKISPVLFEFPGYKYLATGRVLGNCLKLGKSDF